MGVKEFRSKVDNLRSSIEQSFKHGVDAGDRPNNAKSFYNFKAKKASYYRSSLEGSYNELKRALFTLVAEAKDQEPVFDIILLWRDLQKNKGDIERTKKILDSMADFASKVFMAEKAATQRISLRIPVLPSEIKEDIAADIKEIEKCFNNSLYRSATILCGRVLETTLHRKYYEATGFDILEKSPGIGLGNLIAKMKEKNIEIDPALTQQIHIVNQVRIFTVHKKKEVFLPSRQQAHAIILYTMDVVGRMF